VLRRNMRTHFRGVEGKGMVMPKSKSVELPEHHKQCLGLVGLGRR